MLRAILSALALTVFLAVPALAQQPAPTPPPGQPPMMGQKAPAAIPNLVGKWEGGDYQLHHKVHGFITNKGNASTLVIKEQEGRVFHGFVEWTGKAPGKDTFSGVIDKDNVTFYFAGHKDALRIGKMEGPDAFTYYYISPGGENPRAGLVEYKRAK